jgi:hypothetical protein
MFSIFFPLQFENLILVLFYSKVAIIFVVIPLILTVN